MERVCGKCAESVERVWIWGGEIVGRLCGEMVEIVVGACVDMLWRYCVNSVWVLRRKV